MSLPDSGAILGAILIAALGLACSSPERIPAPEPGFIHVRGGKLVDGSGPVMLEGIRFENWLTDPNAAFETHHDEADYAQVLELGFNTVHFSLSLERFELEPYVYDEDAFAWLDTNVEWAKRSGLKLMLALDAPRGAPPEECKHEQYARLWEEEETQARVIAFMRSVAQRFADEPTVAGYQLLASPTPKAIEQFQTLIDDMIAAVRLVDTQHLLVVPQVVAVGCDYALPLGKGLVDSAPQRQLKIDDPNVAYAFTFDWPRHFTSQGLDSSGLPAGERYPDDERLVVDWGPEHIHPLGWTEDSTPDRSQLDLKPGESQWIEKRFGYRISDEACDVANVTLLSRNNPGTVCFDDVLVEEYEEDETPGGKVFKLDLESHHGWFLWEDGEGTGTASTDKDGASGKAVCLSGTTTDASLGYDYLFPVKRGRSYNVTYWIRGENVSDASESLVKLDFYDYQLELEYRNRDALRRRLEAYVALAEELSVPLYLDSFGTSLPSFTEELGGIGWVTDVLEFAREHGLSYAYRAYHDGEYGLYAGDEGLPNAEALNMTLAELFRKGAP